MGTRVIDCFSHFQVKLNCREEILPWEEQIESQWRLDVEAIMSKLASKSWFSAPPNLQDGFTNATQCSNQVWFYSLTKLSSYE